MKCQLIKLSKRKSRKLSNLQLQRKLKIVAIAMQKMKMMIRRKVGAD